MKKFSFLLLFFLYIYIFDEIFVFFLVCLFFKIFFSEVMLYKSKPYALDKEDLTYKKFSFLLLFFLQIYVYIFNEILIFVLVYFSSKFSLIYISKLKFYAFDKEDLSYRKILFSPLILSTDIYVLEYCIVACKTLS